MTTQAMELWVQLSTPPARSDDDSLTEKVLHKFESQQFTSFVFPRLSA